MSTVGHQSPQTLLVVCRANLIRSVVASALLRDHFRRKGRGDLEVTSAGLQADSGSAPPDAVLRAGEELGLDLSGHRSTQLTPADVSDADLVLSMTEAQRAAVVRLSRSATPRVFTLVELVRLATAYEVIEEETLNDLARTAHLRRPLVASATAPEDVPDPIGRGERYLRDMVEDLVALCGHVAARMAAAPVT